MNHKTKDPGSSSSHSSSEYYNSDRTLNAISLEYSYEELQQSTNDFSPASKIGQGAYGNVYRGVLRDGNEVAIKYLHGGHQSAGFEEEVKVLSKFRHQNLVILMGFSRHGSQRLLVYELLPGGDVGSRLQKGPLIGWRQRLNIALDSACGLSHLHNQNPKVFHRDIKSANILLDRNGTAKWGDFGLACLSAKLSHKVHQTAGTVGYADPKYISSAIVTENTEVYSYGWVLIELLTAKPPAVQHHDGRISYFFSKLKDVKTGTASLRSLLQYSDRSAGFPEPIKIHLAKLALRCINPDEAVRPCFRSIVLELRKFSKDCDSIYSPQMIAPQMIARVSDQLSGGQVRMDDIQYQQPQHSHQGVFVNKYAYNTPFTPRPYCAFPRTVQKHGKQLDVKNFHLEPNDSIANPNFIHSHQNQIFLHSNPWPSQRLRVAVDTAFPKDSPLNPPATNAFFSGTRSNPSDFVEPNVNWLSPPIYRSSNTSSPDRDRNSISHTDRNNQHQFLHDSVTDPARSFYYNSLPIKRSDESECLHPRHASSNSMGASIQPARPSATDPPTKIIPQSEIVQGSDALGPKSTTTSFSVESTLQQLSQFTSELKELSSERTTASQSSSVVDMAHRQIAVGDDEIGSTIEQSVGQSQVEKICELQLASDVPSFMSREKLNERFHPGAAAAEIPSALLFPPTEPIQSNPYESYDSSQGSRKPVHVSRIAFNMAEGTSGDTVDRINTNNAISSAREAQSLRRQTSTLMADEDRRNLQPVTNLTPRSHEVKASIPNTISARPNHHGFPEVTYVQNFESTCHNSHSSPPMIQSASQVHSSFNKSKPSVGRNQTSRERCAKPLAEVDLSLLSPEKATIAQWISSASSDTVQTRQEDSVPFTARSFCRNCEFDERKKEKVRIELKSVNADYHNNPVCETLHEGMHKAAVPVEKRECWKGEKISRKAPAIIANVDKNRVESGKQTRALSKVDRAKESDCTANSIIVRKEFKIANGACHACHAHAPSVSESLLDTSHECPNKVLRHSRLTDREQPPKKIQTVPRNRNNELLQVKGLSRNELVSRRSIRRNDYSDTPSTQFSLKSAGSDRSVATPVFGLDDETSIDRKIPDSSEDDASRLVCSLRSRCGKLIKTIEKNNSRHSSDDFSRSELVGIEVPPNLKTKRNLGRQSFKTISDRQWEGLEKSSGNDVCSRVLNQPRMTSINKTSSTASVKSVPISRLARLRRPTLSVPSDGPAVHVSISQQMWDGDIETCHSNKRRNRITTADVKSAKKPIEDLQRSIGVTTTTKVKKEFARESSINRSCAFSMSSPLSMSPIPSIPVTHRPIQDTTTRCLDFADSASSDASADPVKIEQITPKSLSNSAFSDQEITPNELTVKDVVCGLAPLSFTSPPFQSSPMCSRPPIVIPIGIVQVSTKVDVTLDAKQIPILSAPESSCQLRGRHEANSDSESSSSMSRHDCTNTKEQYSSSHQSSSDDARSNNVDSVYSSSFRKHSFSSKISLGTTQPFLHVVNPLMVMSELAPVVTASSLLRDGYDFPYRDWKVPSPYTFGDFKPLHTGFSLGLCSTASGGSVVGQPSSVFGGSNSFDLYHPSISLESSGCGMLTESHLSPCHSGFLIPSRADGDEYPLG